MISKSDKLPRIALCGRSNVGKSSLFNRLLGRKKALVLDEPGVTRDVLRAVADLEGLEVELCDLAGLENWADYKATLKEDQRKLRALGTQAAMEYLKHVDLILFLVDARAGVMPEDRELLNKLRKFGKKTLLVLTKAEGKTGDQIQSDATELGLGEGLAVSAEHKTGIEDLKIAIRDLFPEYKKGVDSRRGGNDERDNEDSVSDDLDGSQQPIKLGVYGRPNVGKSSFVNWLLGEGRMITSPIAGTTVDTVDTEFEHAGQRFKILDTPGIRRKSKTEQGVEVLSVVKALHSLKDVEIALFMIDGYEGVTDQDEKIAGEIVNSGKATVIVVNKWDLCKRKKEDYAEQLRDNLDFLKYAPVLFISTLKKQGLEPLWDLVPEILAQRKTIAQTSEINRFLQSLEGIHANKGDVKIYYASQTSSNPPTVTCVINDPRKMNFSFERYIKNELRGRFGWMGSPIRLKFTKSKEVRRQT